MADPAGRDGFEPSGFFVLRTPLLPITALSEASASPADLAGSLERARRLLQEPHVREALQVASPSLGEALRSWPANRESKAGRRAEVSLTRYLQRMATRPTPFGLFAGYSVGRLAGRTELTLPPTSEYRRQTRLDADYLCALIEEIQRRPEIRRELPYRLNSSLYRSGGKVRYVEARFVGADRHHHLVAADDDSILEAALAAASPSARFEAVVDAILSVPEAAGVERPEARAYVDELIEAQLLVPAWGLAVTGEGPLEELLTRLQSLPEAAGYAGRLEEVRELLARLEQLPLGSSAEGYAEIENRLASLPTPVDPARMVQIDMVKPASELTLGPAVLDEVERGIGILHRLCTIRPGGPLDRLRDDLVRRYGAGCWVSLSEALDEETGVGFASEPGTSAEASPLLATLPLAAGVPPDFTETVPWGPVEELKLRLIERASEAGTLHAELTDEDLKELPEPARPLPGAFQTLFSLAADSPRAVDEGDFQLWLSHFFGPSGGRGFGRFCGADPELRDWVEHHLRQEEALDPDTIYAEIVHLPESRVANVLTRPVLRSHEITYLGHGGAAAEAEIPATDLEIAVLDDELVLRSRRLGKRVIPRLTTAHSFTHRALALYQFLGFFQARGFASMEWEWGPVGNTLNFLPRITCGRLVLSKARWRLPRSVIRELEAAHRSAERSSAVDAWRRAQRLPKKALLLEGDNQLLVDFTDALSLQAFLSLARDRHAVAIGEIFPAFEALPVHGPEGPFVHEIILPMVRRQPMPRPRWDVAAAGAERQQLHLPGSDWLYAKLFTGSAGADRVIQEVVAPVAARALEAGSADRWFFIRYGEGGWHVRFRLHGDPTRLWGQVLPALHQAAAPLIEDGTLHRLELAGYEPETERYGGPAGLELAEQLFQIDSEAVVQILPFLEGDSGEEVRWRIALVGTDRWLDDLGLDDAEKVAALEDMCRFGHRRFGPPELLRKPLAARLRKERRALDALLQPDSPLAADPLFAGALAALELRSRRLRPWLDRLWELERRRELAKPPHQLAFSYVHMFANRLIRADANAHELVIADFLLQLTRSRLARQRQKHGRTERRSA